MKTVKEYTLVIYKGAPAMVQKAEQSKFQILTASGGSKSVREKDFIPLFSSGKSFSPSGVSGADLPDLSDVWEMSEGEPLSFETVLELLTDSPTCDSAWGCYQSLVSGEYFSLVSLNEIIPLSNEDVRARQEKLKKQEEEKEEHNAFLERLKSGHLNDADRSYFRQVEDLANGFVQKCRLFEELKQKQTPESAHEFLLKHKIWDEYHNPWPFRFGQSLTVPEIDLDEITDEHRKDLTDFNSYAIDDEGSNDPDDAIGISGDWFWVHIADAAALIKAGNSADKEARNRGANLYLPDRTITMLPSEATDKLALGLAEISPALSFGFRFDSDYEIIEKDVCLSKVRVIRTSYTAVESLFETEPYKTMKEITDKFDDYRESHGALSLNLPEVKIRVIDNEILIKNLPDLKSRKLVTNAMLMAGESAGLFALRNKFSVPFATQELNDVNEDEWTEPVTMSDMFQARRRFKRSQMSSHPSIHKGLGLPVYARATSPLRRYPDLVTCQQIRSFLLHEDLMDAEEVMKAIGAFEAVSGNVAQAERASNTFWKIHFLKQNPDWSGEAVLVDRKRASGVFLIPSLAMETLIPFKEKIELDSVVRVEVNRVKLSMNEVIFKIID